jgi:putative DNA primase/helicase
MVIIPLTSNNGEVVSFQYIKENGEKRFMAGGSLNNSFVKINCDGKSEFVFLCEGYVTGATISLAFPNAIVFCSLSASRIPVIADCISKNYPTKKILICADLDKNETGLKYASSASDQISNCIHALPDFSNITNGESFSDFNDLYAQCGLDEVRRQLGLYLAEFSLRDFDSDLKNGFYNQGVLQAKNYKRLADYFNFLYHYTTNENGRTFIFDHSHFREISEYEIRSFAEKYFTVANSLCSKRDADEFLGLIKRTKFSNNFFENIENNKRYINFLNGVYDLSTNKLLPHSHNYKFKTVIPHNYIPEACCPFWNEFLNNFTLGRCDLKNILQEFLGYCISGFPYDQFSIALILFGEGANGKSTLVRIIQLLVGGNNHSACVISDIGKNRFTSAHLSRSLVNISEEEPPHVFSNTDYFKKLTGGSPIYAEDKGKDGYNFNNRSKLIITYNRLPKIADDSFGFKRRLLIIPCDANYNQNPDLKIKNLEEKISLEISGLINFCLEGLKRLIQQEQFSESTLVNDCVSNLMSQNDPFEAWWSDSIKITGNTSDRFTTRFMLDHFNDYHKKCGILNPTQFGRLISEKIKILKTKNESIFYGAMRLSGQEGTHNGVKGIIVLNVIDV